MKRFLMSVLLGLTVIPLAACGDKEAQGEQITLNYAVVSKVEGSEVPSIEELMLKEFEKNNPNVKVNPIQIDWSISDTWGETIYTLGTTGTIVDVFLIPRVEDLASKGILADISEFYDADEDTNAIFDHVANLGEFEGKRFSVPTFIYPTFWVVNETLLGESSITTPSPDWSWGQMEAIAQPFQDINDKHGLYGTAPYLYEGPKYIKKVVEKDPAGDNWYARSYDGTKFNYDDNATVASMNNLYTGMQAGWISANAMEAPELDPRYLGDVAIWTQPAWEFKDYAPEFDFDYKILPAPSQIGMGNTDVIGIHELSQNKEAAYDLLKWMSYDEEGILKRFEIYNENIDVIGLAGNNFPMPVADYGNDPYTGENLIWDNIPYANLYADEDGSGPYEYLRNPNFLSSIRNAAIQANKEVVGWNSSDVAISSYFAEVEAFEKTYTDVVANIQADSNTALKKAIEELQNSIK